MGKVKKQRVSLSNEEITASRVWLDQMARGINDPIFGWRIGQNLKPLAELEEEYNETRRNILTANHAVVENGQFKTANNQFVFESKQDSDTAASQIKELLAAESEVEYYPIKLSQIAEKVKLTDGQPVYMFTALEWMIVMDIDFDDSDEDEPTESAE